MFKFLNANKGLFMMVGIFFTINRFAFLSLETLLAVIMFVVGIYFKEVAMINFMNAEHSQEIKVYDVLLNDKIFNKCMKDKLINAIAKYEISDSEEENMKKLYQIRRIAFKLSKDKNGQV